MWEVVDDFEWVELEIINVKSLGYRKVVYFDIFVVIKIKWFKDYSFGKDDRVVLKNVSKFVELNIVFLDCCYCN